MNEHFKFYYAANVLLLLYRAALDNIITLSQMTALQKYLRENAKLYSFADVAEMADLYEKTVRKNEEEQNP